MILNIRKPVGWTSFDVVKKIRSITREKKVGHGGTLDPFAEGVLIIGTGKDTKRLNGITHSDKSYTAVLSLGTGTDTLDTEGNVTDQKQVPALTVEKIESVLHSFLGKTMQMPPMFSAKKINGIRLYKLARKNIEIDRKPVEIHIRDIQFLDYCDHKIIFTVICSKGTYIRVLGKDIAEKLDTVGHLTALIRTRVGGYSINESQTIENFMAKWKS
tara:strand:+ start:170 stop:814 length:645 start_codon:yes stop_codon:yes gene_type:complete